MGTEPEELVLDGIPALRWGRPGGRAVIGVHGRFSNKRDPVMAQCGDVIASRGDQLITFDLPTHGNRQDDKAFNPMEASPEVRTFAQLARSQSTEIGLLANSIGAYFSLCDTPAGTFERAWLVSPLLDLEYYIRDMMAECSVTDEQLEAETVINTPRGVLEWPYLRFVEKHPARLDIPSWIIRGDQDEVVPLDALSRFVGAPGVELVRSRVVSTSLASPRILTQWWHGSRNAIRRDKDRLVPAILRRVCDDEQPCWPRGQMRRGGNCVVRPGRTSPTNDCHRVSEVCRKTQSSPEKYAPDQNQRTAL